MAKSEFLRREMIGNSRAIAKVRELLDKAASSDEIILITGETGTGKELVAREIHLRSGRAEGPFEAVNCAALPPTLATDALFGHKAGAFTHATSTEPGRFVRAEFGTLFLDEIAELPLECQALLLRVVQEGVIEPVGGPSVKVDVRLIAATHANLPELVKQKKFREDLYHRLNVVPIHLPPLRQRKGDIEALVRHFVEEVALRNRRKVPTIEPEFIQALEGRTWPGNIRQLETTVTRAVVLDSVGVLSEPPPPERDEVRGAVNIGDEALRAALRRFVDLGDIPDLSRKSSKRVVEAFKQATSKTKVRDIGREFSKQEARLYSRKDFPDHLTKLLKDRSPEFDEWHGQLVAAAASERPEDYSIRQQSQLQIEERCARLQLDKLYTPRGIESSIDAFLAAPVARLFVIADRAGSGKTSVVLAKAQQLTRAGVLVISISGPEIDGSDSHPCQIEHTIARTAGVDADMLRRGNLPAAGQLWDLLLAARGSDHALVVVIDGINESPLPIHALREALESTLLRVATREVKIILTSRIEVWSQGADPLDRICDHHAVSSLVFGFGDVDMRRGSALLSGPAGRPGSFADEEFDAAWRKYSEVYELDARPVLHAKEALRQPLVMSLFCQVNARSSLGQFSRIRSSHVLRSYAKLVCAEVRTGLPQLEASVEAIDEWFDCFLRELSHRTLELGDLVVRTEQAHDLLTRSAPPIVREPSQHCESILERLVSRGMLEHSAGGYKIAFDLLAEFYAGRRLAHRGIYDDMGFLRRAYWALTRSTETAPLAIGDVLRHTVLERETISLDYIDLLAQMAESGPALQEAACEAVTDLQVVSFDADDLKRPPMRVMIERNRRSPQLRALLGLSDAHSSEGDHPGAEAVKLRREAVIRRLFNEVLRRIPLSRDFVVGFTLEPCVAHLAERYPAVVEERLLGWLGSGSGLEKTVALNAMPRLRFSEPLVACVLRLLAPGGGFWLQRSAAETAIQMVEVAGGARGDGVYERLELCLGQQVEVSARDSIHRAMLSEKYVRLRSAALRVPGPVVAAELARTSWVAVSCCRALLGVVSGCERAYERGNDAARVFVGELREWVRSLGPVEILTGLEFEPSWPLKDSLQRSWASLLTALDVAEVQLPTPEPPHVGAVRASMAVIFCFEFLAGSLRDHPECKERVYAIMLRLEQLRASGRLRFDYHGAEPATVADLTARTCDGRPIHAPSYVDTIRQIDMALESGAGEWEHLRSLELRPGSWLAACRSAGAVLRALDLVDAGEYRAVLCPNRPPGHLAGNRICIFDNVAVAAAQAIRRGLRVLVFDADAHHGLHVQKTFWYERRVLYCSIHESRVHPGQGYPTQIGGLRTVGGVVCDGIGTTINVSLDPDPDPDRSCATYMAAFKRWIVPAARRFAPDLVIIAGGGDADYRDAFSNLNLRPSCAEQTTRTLAEFARKGVIVALEGGYEVFAGLADWWEAFGLGLAPPAPDSEQEPEEPLPPEPEGVDICEVLRDFSSPIQLGRRATWTTDTFTQDATHLLGSSEGCLRWDGRPDFIMRLRVGSPRQFDACLRDINLACDVEVSILCLKGVWIGERGPEAFVGVLLRGDDLKVTALAKRLVAVEIDRSVKGAARRISLTDDIPLDDFSIASALFGRAGVGLAEFDFSHSVGSLITAVWCMET
jgi:transcriptional regulator with AAA-type ATPase domain/acetoin utilization deacetylase AcuC-like enzyme